MSNNSQYLYQTLNTARDFVDPSVIEIPKYINDNLKYQFFDWQKNAFENFLINESNPKYKKNPTHLMFNMATGTGKTLLMAATLLYYYKQGYRHFIFFVNQNNIVDKTENNFIDNTHNKYLFKENIVIDNKTINIKQVDTFSDSPQSIEIKFTTIQKLYNDIHLEKENQTTLEDLHKKDIVMFADEAHSLNTLTRYRQNEQIVLDLKDELKDNASKKDIERKGWEHTVRNLILNKNGQSENNTNVLLEFTATIPSVAEVVEKYKPITVTKFDLKPFMLSGYTKQINLISSTLDKKERILQALVFNWYRCEIALKNNIANFKPVILFRSKTINESKQDYDDFIYLVSDVNTDDFNFLRTVTNTVNNSQKLYEQGQSRTNDVLKFIKDNNIKYSKIARWVKDNFTDKSVIITNSKNSTKTKEKTTEEQEKLLNNLEDKDNHIRAIFTVKRLTEGWDVLNLFDIVRLYQGQNSGGATERAGNVPEATTQEKQLIGRGVRYYPFVYKDKQINKRKFDNEPSNELRILEELFYYTYDEDSRYISHLVKELKSDGYITDDRVFKTFNLKSSFKDNDFYKNAIVWHNEWIDNPHRKKKTLKDIEQVFENKILSLNIDEEKLIADGDDDKQNIVHQQANRTTEFKLKDIDKHIFRKALNIKAQHSNTLFQFSKLKDELEISSMDDLLKDEFLGDFSINFIHSENITNKDKLNAVLKFLNKIFNELGSKLNPKIGDDFKTKKLSDFFSKPKTKVIKKENLDDSVAKNNDWYVLDGFVGTSEEKYLIEFITGVIGNLKEKYNEVYLLRNEEVYTIHNFKDGRGFQPDFILFLKNENKNLYYQVFIEPKGNQYKGVDGTFKDGKEYWKEEFLEGISKKYGSENILGENKNYYLIGLPFSNKDNNKNFSNEFKIKLDI